LTLVERLVRCPSPSGREADVACILIAEMEARGFTARLDEEGNVVGAIGRGSKRVYLIGHLDTVSGDLPVRIEEGKLFGRGSVDAKGALAVCVEAASGFAESSRLTLNVIGCVGEEAESQGARHVLSSLPAPDFVIVAEPSGWEAMTLGYKGALPVRYTLEKRRTHSGAPTSTVAEDGVGFYETVCAAYPDRGVGFADVSIRLASFNTHRDAVHEQVKVSLDVRTPPDFDHDAFRRLVQDAAGCASLEIGEFTPAVKRPNRNELVRAMLAGIRALAGAPAFKLKTGTSDMNLFQSWDVPMIAYGPGDSSLDHTPDEHLDLDEYAKAIAVLSRAMEYMERDRD
jgi:LysW-gamma-L-lysine carboxypeptidase